MGEKTEVWQGTLALMVLRTLQMLGPLHGYAVVRWITQRTDDALRIEEGALYPALHRMEQREWIEAEWGVSENNRRAKFYRLTEMGRRQLHSEAESWRRYAEAVGKVLATATATV